MSPDRDGSPERPRGYRARIATAIADRRGASAALRRLWPGRRAVLVSFAAAAAILVAGAAIGGGLMWRHLLTGMPAQPDVDSLWALGREPSIEVLDREGGLIGHRGPSYARRVAVDDLPPHLVAAFLAAEDRRFFRHNGVDPQSVLRAALANWNAGETVQGGSTLTQQLVKNLVVGPERTLRRKAQEMLLAVRLEQQLTKQEILELYLNRVYLGERAYGVEAASLRYFGHSAREATLAESALLAALPKAPTRLSPTANLTAARARAALVLDRMEDARFITQEQAAQAVAQPAELVALPRTAGETGFGYAFDEAARAARALAPDAPDLVVHTTLDPAMQRAGEAALTAMLDGEGARSRATQGALVALDYNGEILAMVGGRDYADSEFNRVTQALRQPGSAFKPFVYAAAFELGMRPATVRDDEPLSIGEWEPENYGGGFRGRVTLREAFYRSINTVAAGVGQDVGAGTVADVARRFGVRTPLNATPSIALGASELTLLELTSAYSVFARRGALQQPFLVSRIADTTGRVLYDRPELSAAQVYDAELARLMRGMMRDVVVRGTGTAAALPDRAAAGKTGTSQDYRDAWFVGFTGDLIAGAWLGNDDNTPMRDVTGGRLPARMWHDFMTVAEEGREDRGLDLPEDDSDAWSQQLAAMYSELGAAFTRAAASR